MRGRLLVLMAALIGAVSIGFGTIAQARIDNDPDCDTVAIIRCGAFSMSKVREKYNNDGLYHDQKTVFAAFGISKDDLNGSFQDGIVYRDGRVTVGGKVVATGAMTAGRWNNPTSDMKRISGTVRAYKMSTSHFVDEGQTAFVKIVNGEFKFAVMKSCGNPVSAKPKPQPAAACKSLSITTLSRTKFRFNGAATTSNGATIYSYNYTIKKGGHEVTTVKNNTSAKTSTYEYNQTTPGVYNVYLSVRTSEGDKTGSQCQDSFTVKEETPVYACTKLNVTKLSDTSWKFATTTSQTNATLKSITYVVTKNGQEVSRSTNATYNQSAPGAYAVQAFATFSVNGADKTVTSDACKGSFTINEVPAYTCDKLTVTNLSATSWKFATATTVKNATLKKIEYVITKDGQEVSRSTNDTYSQTTPGTYNVQAFVTVTVNGQDKTVTSDACKATIAVNENPAYTCDKLTATKLSDTSWKFATSYTVKNATFKNVTYVVTKAGQEVSRSTDDTYTQATPGDYTVQAFLTVTVNGEDKTVTSEACKANFSVAENPAYSCDSLEITKLSDTSWKFKTNYTVKNATLKKIEYVVTDKDGKEVSRSTNDTYNQTGVSAFTVQAFVTVTVDGEDKTVTSEACTGSDKPEFCTAPNGQEYPKGAKECEVCQPKAGEDENCKPKELPKTGPTENALAIIGLGALVVSTGYYISSRRALNN